MGSMKPQIISDNAQRILTEKNYFRNGETHWGDITDRVSKGISLGEPKVEDRENVAHEINEALKSLEFIFSSPCLLNASVVNPGQLSSCFVVGLRDNIEAISKCDANFAKIFQRNGGAGTDLSVLRPNKSRVENTNGYSCGVVGFMYKFNATADIMTRNNPTKRGALKLNLSVWHPDIIDFIHSKSKDGELSLMNISVSLFDEFMMACLNDEDWNLEFPDYSFNKEVYNNEWDGDLALWKEKGYPVVVYQTIKARELLDILCLQAWKTGEPGVNFQDVMNRANMNPHLGRQIFTNPCNEFANLIYTSCNLASLNLLRLVIAGKFDRQKFIKMVKNGIRWLDDMISVNKLPLPEIQEMTEKIRPVGLGVMGFADVLYALRIPYNSVQGIQFADDLFSLMRQAAIEASSELAEERGCYPGWEGSKWQQMGIPMRNSNLLSIAPTGTISTIADVSGSIEPNFALVFYRKTNSGQKYLFVNETFKAELVERGIYSEELLEKIFKNHGSCVGISEVPEDMQRIYVTAHDITPMDHLDMVAVIQKHIDLAISKTINFENSVPVEDIKGVITEAWKKGVKGMTVYRDGCRSDQTLTTGSTYDKKEEPKKIKTRREMGRRLPGATYDAESACGKFYLTVNRDAEGNFVETFVNFKKGLCKSNIDGLNRMISLALRNGIPAEAVIEQLKGISCSACTRVASNGDKQIDGISCPDIIAKVLEQEFKMAATNQTPVSVNKVEFPAVWTTGKDVAGTGIDANLVKSHKTPQEVAECIANNICPECGTELTHGACVECPDCGWNKCGA